MWWTYIESTVIDAPLCCVGHLSTQGATKLFSWLKDCEAEAEAGNVHRHLPYDSSKAEKHAKFCLDNIERAAQHLNHEKLKAQQQQEVRERHQRALEKVRSCQLDLYASSVSAASSCSRLSTLIHDARTYLRSLVSRA